MHTRARLHGCMSVCARPHLQVPFTRRQRVFAACGEAAALEVGAVQDLFGCAPGRPTRLARSPVLHLHHLGGERARRAKTPPRGVVGVLFKLGDRVGLGRDNDNGGRGGANRV
eukprot:352731-Chlamydomonas_euryale.AAC.7